MKINPISGIPAIHNLNNVQLNETILRRLEEKVEKGEFATIHEAANLIMFQGLLSLLERNHE